MKKMKVLIFSLTAFPCPPNYDYICEVLLPHVQVYSSEDNIKEPG